MGIAGCGAIGCQLAFAIKKHFKSKARVAYLCDLDPLRAVSLMKKLGGNPGIMGLDELIKKSDLIIESASQQAALRIIRAVEGCNKMVLIMSVGGVLRAKRVSLETFEHSKGAQFWIPSGAVAGIDGLLAAKEGGLKRVRLITRKPPDSLKGALYFTKHRFPILRGIKEYRVFKGSAEQAVRAFPQNINVAAILSFAGIGARRTEVELWTSWAYKKNQHEILIEYKTGKIHIQAENDPLPDNPKTSALAVYAAIATLRRIFSSFRIGT